MKIAQEYIKKYNHIAISPIINPGDKTEYFIYEHELAEILIEDRKEIRDKIEEMIKRYQEVTNDYLWENDITDKAEENILKSICEARVFALTELLTFIKEK